MISATNNETSRASILQSVDSVQATLPNQRAICNDCFMRRTLDTICILTMTRIQLLSGTGRTLPHVIRHYFGLLLFGAFAISASTHAGVHNPSGATIQASVLYHNYCSVCHGEKGNGQSRAQYSLNPPPLDFTSAKAAQLPRLRMIEAVTNGKPGTAMSAWKTQLNPEEVGAVVDYVRNTFMPASTASDNSRGRTVFSKNCSVCHGEKGDGRSRAQGSLNPPPRDFTAPGVKAELTQERMITSVTFGRADTAMAGFKTQLSPEDINAVVAYIRSSIMGATSTEGISGIRHGRHQAAADGSSAPSSPAGTPIRGTTPPTKPMAVNMSAPMPRGLKGDAIKGGGFYMGNCATCHGSAGDGRGPRAYFINPKPRNFLHPASRQEFNRVKLFEMISDGERGSEMPAWKQVLSPQEIANVAEFVFQKFIQPPVEPTKAAK
jgi:mono/diheme cytochrome c family protein